MLWHLSCAGRCGDVRRRQIHSASAVRESFLPLPPSSSSKSNPLRWASLWSCAGAFGRYIPLPLFAKAPFLCLLLPLPNRTRFAGLRFGLVREPLADTFRFRCSRKLPSSVSFFLFQIEPASPGFVLVLCGSFWQIHSASAATLSVQRSILSCRVEDGVLYIPMKSKKLPGAKNFLLPEAFYQALCCFSPRIMEHWAPVSALIYILTCRPPPLPVNS